MGKSITKYALVFFTPADEEMFSELIRQQVPDLCWLDGSKWPSPEPPVRKSPSECQKNVIYLWSPSVHRKLMSKERPSGGFQGPGNVVVVMLDRCGMRDGFLQNGAVNIGYDEEDIGMAEFVKVIWKALRSMKSATLTSYDPSGETALHSGISDCIVGPDATSFASESPLLASGIVRFKADKISKEKKSRKTS